ncbi:MAG TPA: ATP-binding protein [Parafilimonas sp.]|nr:ATP-binding protein [Parafilimonas sp.]
MRPLYLLLAFIIALGYSFKSFGQINGDSLKNEILKSVQQDFSNPTNGNLFFDTSKLFSGESPVHLDKMFEELNKEIEKAKSMGDIQKVRGRYYDLSKLDSVRGNYKGAYEHYKLYSLYHDSLQKKETEKKELQAKMQYEFEKQKAIAKAEQEKKDAEQKRIKNLQYFTIAGLAMLVLVIMIIALIQWKNSNQRKKANTLLQLQKEKVESALSELKSAQAHLIHSEKMASLGELTAGIAHEIQNPLNFVNNFSEVSNELVDEMKTELATGNLQPATHLADDIKGNLQKIIHHGKRADAIVKGMLQHTRITAGQKEPTDINALADEYLRLSYHGMRAKDNSFTAEIKTDFDESVGKINVVPQDIGRALLNLYTNAFYAVREKSKNPRGFENRRRLHPYVPTVTVVTRKITNKIEIKVKDNGPGIPQGIADKIFQPFFTTKPSGEGTGLGLSLAYDIIKAHGGEIKVETKERQGVPGEGSTETGTEFMIGLPFR